MAKRRKIRLHHPVAAYAKSAAREIVRELSAGTFDNILFAAREAKTGEWVTITHARDDFVFYGCEILRAKAQAKILVNHLNRIEGGDGGA